MAFRDTASFGKRQEYVAVAELLKRGFDVYMTLVDDQQIDCVVRLDEEQPRYIDVQIKARSKSAKNPGTFAAMTIRKPRQNLFFLFYSELADCYWVVPSLDLVAGSNQNKTGKNAGRYRTVFTNTLKSGEARPRPKWEDYRNNFDLLRLGATR